MKVKHFEFYFKKKHADKGCICYEEQKRADFTKLFINIIKSFCKITFKNALVERCLNQYFFFFFFK